MVSVVVKTCTKCGLEKSIENFSKHPTGAHGVRPDCRACCKLRNAKYRAVAREKISAQRRQYRAINRDAIRKKTAAWRAAHSEYCKQVSTSYYRENRGERLAYQHAHHTANADKIRVTKRRYRGKNRAKLNIDKAVRKNRLRRATVKFSDPKKIREKYEQASRLTAATGVPHHVDHIVPIQSDYVCGLHVHWNLQVLTLPENVRKGNRHWPDMPELPAWAHR